MMKKRELISIHIILFNAKRILEYMGCKNRYFELYDTLEIYPSDLYRVKSDHKRAISLLCKGIINCMGSKKEKEAFLTNDKYELRKLKNDT